VVNRCAIALAVAFSFAQPWKEAAPQGRNHMTDQQVAVVEANQEYLIGWLEALDRAGPKDYIKEWAAVPDEANVRHFSETWCSRFFRPAFDPYRQTGEVIHSASPATPDGFDILRHEYAVQGMRLEVLETVQFTVLRFETSKTLLHQSEEEKKKAISRAVAHILNLPGEFKFPPKISDGTFFSTHPEANPVTLNAWTDRVDGGIRQGRLFFLCYKRIEPTAGKPIFLNGQHWFDGKCWKMAEPHRE
jgi:hypothetical protein